MGTTEGGSAGGQSPGGPGHWPLTPPRTARHDGVVTVTERDHGGHREWRPETTVRTGPGVATDAITYVTERLLDLSRYAPRPIDAIDAAVTRPHDHTRSRAVEVRASLMLGRHTLRARQTATNLHTAMSGVHERLRRQLGHLQRGGRRHYPPHRRNTVSERHRPNHGLRVRRAEVNGRHPWVLEDDAGIVEITESREALAEDHPEAPVPPDEGGRPD
jgi:ribosome-associated translation inhibitor RaiA